QARMPGERHDNSWARKENGRRAERQHDVQSPDRDFAALMKQFFQRIRAEAAGEGGNKEEPNPNTNEDCGSKEFVPQDFDRKIHLQCPQKFLRRSMSAYRCATCFS